MSAEEELIIDDPDDDSDDDSDRTVTEGWDSDESEERDLYEVEESDVPFRIHGPFAHTDRTYGIYSGRAERVDGIRRELRLLEHDIRENQPRVEVAVATQGPGARELIVTHIEQLKTHRDLIQQIESLKQPPRQSPGQPSLISFTFSATEFETEYDGVAQEYHKKLKEYQTLFPPCLLQLWKLRDEYDQRRYDLERAIFDAKKPNIQLVAKAQELTELANEIFFLDISFESDADEQATRLKLSTATVEMMKRTLATMQTNRNRADENYKETRRVYKDTQPKKRLDSQLPADRHGEFLGILQCVEDQLPCSEERVGQMLSKVDELVAAMKDSLDALWRSIRYLEAARQCCSNVIDVKVIPRRFDKRTERWFSAKTGWDMLAIECVQTGLIHGVKKLPIKPQNGKIGFPAQRAIAPNKWRNKKRKRQETSNQ